MPPLLTMLPTPLLSIPMPRPVARAGLLVQTPVLVIMCGKKPMAPAGWFGSMIEERGVQSSPKNRYPWWKKYAAILWALVKVRGP